MLHRLRTRTGKRRIISKRYEIKRTANIKTPDGNEAVFYEVWDVVDVDGEERTHRNYDRAFKAEAEAQAWIDKQGG